MKQVRATNGNILSMNDDETEVFYSNEWRPAQEDQDGELFFMAGREAIYFTLLPETEENTEKVTIKNDGNNYSIYNEKGNCFEDGFETYQLAKTYANELGYEVVEAPASPVEMLDKSGEGFTPGPWGVDGLAIDSNQFEICVVSQGTDEDGNKMKHEEAEANARLIASAPAMYKALKECQEWYERNAHIIAPDTRFALQRHLKY